MNIKTPILDKRTSEVVYEQALILAKQYCPEWTKNWGSGHFDPDDPGLVIFKLFSNMAKHLITQYNRIPEKHFIAFLDFMDIDIRPPQAAAVPLTFYPAKGAPDVQVVEIKERTPVASSKEPDVVFETVQHLSAANIKYYAFSINPQEDSYTDHSKALSEARSFSIFSNDKDQISMEHILFIGDKFLFDQKNQFQSLRIKFNGSNLSDEYFSQWSDGKGYPVKVERSPQEDDKNLIIVIKEIPKIEQSSINEINNYWLMTRPDPIKKITSGSNIPSISEITVEMISGKIMPESVFYNDVPPDMKKGFYPFGESPKVGDVLYICSNEALSKENSVLKFNIELDRQLENIIVEISWEFWDGISWKVLPVIKDEINHFSGSGLCSMEFYCPDADQCEINGVPGRWIRAKIKSGGYGSPEKYEEVRLDKYVSTDVKNELEKKGISFGLKYIPGSYTPPFIKSIYFEYYYKDKHIQNVLTRNHFQYTHWDNKTPIIPYEPFPGECPAFYLGFEKIEKIIDNTRISIYFSVKEKHDTGRSNFTWKYLDKTGWKKLNAQIELDLLNKSGIAGIIFPDDMKKSYEFGKELFWIKIEPEDKKLTIYPELEGIYPNTVMASNFVTVENEILGSGNGMPDQTFHFSRKSVLSGQIVEVNEGNEWIQWNETSSFAGSNKLSRDYIIDRNEGRIFFGNGINGMIPPKGKNNIKAVLYRSGGGIKGNKGIETIDTLRKANSLIERVTNHVPSSGGIDQENNENAVLRGPFTIRNGGCAVTADDFEWLAREASPDIVRAKCILADKKNIEIIILPEKKAESFFSQISLIDTVEKYLKKRALFSIVDKIHVYFPEYKTIDVEVFYRPKPESLSEYSIISDRIKSRLKLFLDPVNGGQYGKGFNFGQKIYLSELASVIDDVQGVDYVEEVTLKKLIHNKVVDKASGRGWISIEEKALPYAGNIEVKMRI
jgi:hypothetical protein